MALDVIVLAAGQGTRMKSGKAKVLHEIAGRAMLEHVVLTARSLCADRIAVVVGHQKEAVKENFNTLQSAVMSAKPNSFKGKYLKSISISSTLGPGIKIGTE